MNRLNGDESGGHGGDLVRAARQWLPEGGKLLDFSSNINPLGPPPGLIDHLREALPEITAYPTPQARELREEIAEYLGVPAGSLMLGNGANELIHLLMLWLKPARVFVGAPTFSEYERAARLAGCPVEKFSLLPEEDFNPLSLGKRLKDGDLLVFCNPNNPTGKLYRREDLLILASEAEARGACLLVDESFLPLTGTGKMENSISSSLGHSAWVALSLTKVWGLPGLRLGCLIGPPEGIGFLTRWGDPWRVNTLAQKAGRYCLGQDSYLADSLALIAEERSFLQTSLEKSGTFKVYAGAANYLLLESRSDSFEVASFQEKLASKGVLIRRADNFPLLDHRHFRIAVKRRAENLRLLEEVNRCMEIDKTNYIRLEE